MGLLSFLNFGSDKLKSALRKGAVVVDVRTANEFDQGKFPGSINIPVDRIPVNLDRFRHFNKPIILVCASGSRSQQAVRILQGHGIKDVYNGGNWEKLARLYRQLQ